MINADRASRGEKIRTAAGTSSWTYRKETISA